MHPTWALVRILAAALLIQALGPCSYTRDLEEAPGCQVLAIEVSRGVNQQVKISI